MFREMRRKRQELEDAEAQAVLAAATSGVLSLVGDDGYPYGVPLSHAYVDGRLVFHGSMKGHKLDAMRANPKASYTVVQQDQVVPEEFTTYFRSVIAFGRMRVLEGDEKLAALRQLSDRFWPGHPEEREAEIAPRLDHMVVFVMDIEHMTGKQARELA
ncbi:MAG: pyridoxamine 5'-phosphate oxidase family protein [Coriobacteriaceae bacterium]|nr:pyridoxamine 5'-phosphate oxidase family protein [Coriobacteriaceae bacterium]